jgi:Protein of unknown function (DUF2800)
MNTKDEREHLPSASSWKRYELCAGSWQLEQKARELGQEAFRESVESLRGDRIHQWLADEKVKLSEAESETAAFLAERARGEVGRIFGEAKLEVFKECRLWFTISGHKLASGRIDRLSFTPQLALIQDFKTGWAEPDTAQLSSQLKALTVISALHLPATLEKVIVQIISGPFGVTESVYGMHELAGAYESVRKTLEAINAPDAPLSPSPEACRYCPAINICQAVRELSKPLTQLQVARLPDGEMAAKLLDQIAIMKELFEQVELHYYERLEKDPTYEIPHWALVPGHTVREVTDWKSAHLRLSEFLDENDVWGAAKYRLEDVEKAIGKKFKLRDKALREKTAEILSGLLSEKPTRASLKRTKNAHAKELTS